MLTGRARVPAMTGGATYHPAYLADTQADRYVLCQSEASWMGGEGLEGKSLHELHRPASAGPRCDSSLSKAEVTERDMGASGMTMMGLGVCCRLRNEAWASQFCEAKPCATPRVGQDRRLSDALTLAVAHEQGSHDLGEREVMDLGFLGSFPHHRRRRTWRGSGVERPITLSRPRDHDNNKADEFASWG